MRIVVKVGTQTLVTARGCLNTQLLGALALSLADMIANGHQPVLVTSGAVGLGRPFLKETSEIKGASDTTIKQAAAAIGQPMLMGMYQQLMSAYNQPVAQVLLSGSDFSHRERYLSIKDTLTHLLNNHILPIVNENDVVSAAALSEDSQTQAFNDNDHLSAILAAKLKADVLVMLTNVNGVYTANPADNPDAKQVPIIRNLSEINQLNVMGQSTMGRGGMQSKLMAAKLAAMSGVNTWIAPQGADLTEAMAGKLDEPRLCGTWIPALSEQLAARDQWIGYGSGFNGVIVINEGARKALLEKGASLLAVGVVSVQGKFMANQVVSIQDEQTNELGRGLCAFSGDTLASWLTQPPHGVELIHRNNMVLYTQYGL